MTPLLTLITPYHFSALLKDGLSLDHLYMLTVVKEGYDLSSFTKAKEKALIQALQRRFLVSEDKKLTPDGERIFAFLESPEVEKDLLKPLTDDGFDTWWKAFPSTDTVIKDEVILYKGTRALKGKKDEAHELYRQVLAEGYTLEQLLTALAYEVNLKVERSIAEKSNKLQYLQNSSTYLRQRTFAQFIEIAELEARQAPQVKKAVGTVDI